MNMENAKAEFTKFAKQYDLSFPKMKRKYEHSFRVMENANSIAKSLNLSYEEIEVATLIGLLHDIGYFEQIKVNNILKENRKIDHGDLGVEVLQKNNYLRNYIDKEDYDTIILKAIKNHNKFKIEDGLSKQELLFAKIIRDADKLDIFYEGAEMFWTSDEEKENINNSIITDEAQVAFIKHIHCDRKDINTKADSIINFIELFFNINFKYDFEIIKKENYVNKILNKFEFKDNNTAKKIEQIKEIANKYIEERLK